VSFFVSVWLLLYCRQCEFTEKKSISGARGSRVRAPALCVDAGGHPSETQEAQLWTKKTSARAVKMLVFKYSNVPIILYIPRSGWLSGGSTPMPLIAGVWHIQSGGPCGASATRQSHSAEKISHSRRSSQVCTKSHGSSLFAHFFTLVATQCAKYTNKIEKKNCCCCETFLRRIFAACIKTYKLPKQKNPHIFTNNLDQSQEHI
jgi:hypothetical protein